MVSSKWVFGSSTGIRAFSARNTMNIAAAIRNSAGPAPDAHRETTISFPGGAR